MAGFFAVAPVQDRDQGRSVPKNAGAETTTCFGVGRIAFTLLNDMRVDAHTGATFHTTVPYRQHFGG